MKSWPPYAAAAATLALHAAMIAMVITALSDTRERAQPPVPLSIRLVQAPVVPAATLPATPPIVTLPPEKRRPAPRRSVESKVSSTTRETAAKPAPIAESPSSLPPSATPATALPAATPVPAPATPPVPARTSASDASYAASNRKPPYPRLSRINEEQGTVVLRVLVSADGGAGAVEIRNTSGYPLLDESARSTVQTWRFKPATVDGKPVAEWYQLAIPFTLQNN